MQPLQLSSRGRERGEGRGLGAGRTVGRLRAAAVDVEVHRLLRGVEIEVQQLSDDELRDSGHNLARRVKFGGREFRDNRPNKRTAGL